MNTNTIDDVVFLWRKNRDGFVIEDTNGTYAPPPKKKRKIAVPVDVEEKSSDDVASEDCIICFEPIEKNHRRGTAHSDDCNHPESTHFECMFQWCRDKASPTCPLCRATLYCFRPFRI